MSKQFVGIELETNDVRAVTLSGRPGRFVVHRAERFRLPRDRGLQEKLHASVAWLREYLSDAPRASVIVSTPPMDSSGKIVELPPASGTTLDELVKFELEHTIPFHKDRCVSDYMTLRSHEEGTVILLGSARTDTVHQIVEWVRAAGGKPSRITISAAGRLALPIFQPAARTNGNQVVAIVDVGAASAEILLAEGGVLCMQRAVNLQSGSNGNATPTRNSEELWRRAVIETRRTVQAYRASHRGSSLGSIMICGEGATPSVAGMFSNELETSVDRFDPWTGFTVAGRSNLVPEHERSAFACATGLAMIGSGRGLEINLIPEDERPGVSPPVRRAITRLSAFLLLALTLIVWVGYSSQSPWSYATDLENQYAQSRESLRRMGGDSSATTQQAAAATPLRQLSEEVRRDSILWLEVLKLLSMRLPAGVTLSELSMEKGQAVVMRGFAKNNVLVAESLAVVRDMPMFIDARLSYSNSTFVADEPRNEFEIIATLEPLVVENRRGQR